jgi:hypothetical protein
MGIMVMAAVCVPRWSCRRRSRTSGGTQASPDQRTDASTAAAAGNRTDNSPGACADQATTDCAVGGIVRVRGGCRGQQECRADHASYRRLPSHSLPPYKGRGRRPPGCRLSMEEIRLILHRGANEQRRLQFRSLLASAHLRRRPILTHTSDRGRQPSTVRSVGKRRASRYAACGRDQTLKVQAPGEDRVRRSTVKRATTDADEVIG